MRAAPPALGLRMPAARAADDDEPDHAKRDQGQVRRFARHHTRGDRGGGRDDQGTVEPLHPRPDDHPENDRNDGEAAAPRQTRPIGSDSHATPATRTTAAHTMSNACTAQFCRLDDPSVLMRQLPGVGDISPPQSNDTGTRHMNLRAASPDRN